MANTVQLGICSRRCHVGCSERDKSIRRCKKGKESTNGAMWRHESAIPESLCDDIKMRKLIDNDVVDAAVGGEEVMSVGLGIATELSNGRA